MWLTPVVATLAYALVVAVWGEVRLEHPLVLALVLALAAIGPRARQFLLDATPYLTIAIGYDAVRYAQAAVVRADGVLGCELRDLELRLFPFPFAEGVTFPDWFAVHHLTVLDLLAAIPYFGFIYIAFLYAAYLFFVDRPRMRRYLWSLAIANYVAFAMYVFLPAAPPWYVQIHGCAIDLSTAPDPAGLVRVDQLLGLDYFTSFYARSSSVFGALPSMHCAFPVVGLLTAWKPTTWKTRWIHLLYASGMFFAAVYLTHHWVIDAVVGWCVAAVSVAIVWGTERLVERNR
jgi:hypothetical protein